MKLFVGIVLAAIPAVICGSTLGQDQEPRLTENQRIEGQRRGDEQRPNASWKAKKLSWGPVDGDIKNPRVENIPIPKNWYAEVFDDGSWPQAKEYQEEEVGPKEPFFQHNFKGARFIRSDDIKLDNLVIFRTTIQTAPDGKDHPDFTNLTNLVPEVPQRGGAGWQGRRRRGGRGGGDQGPRASGG